MNLATLSKSQTEHISGENLTNQNFKIFNFRISLQTAFYTKKNMQNLIFFDSVCQSSVVVGTHCLEFVFDHFTNTLRKIDLGAEHPWKLRLKRPRVQYPELNEGV